MPAVAAGDFLDPRIEADARLLRPRELGPVVQSVAEELAGFERTAEMSAAGFHGETGFPRTPAIHRPS